MTTHRLEKGGSAVLLAAIASAAALSVSPQAAALPDRCTNLINYAGDPRSNAEINSIGAAQGFCPTPLGPQQAPAAALADVPGMVSGAALGQQCSNTERFIFGKAATGETMACLANSGTWVGASKLYGVQSIGTPCGGGSGAAQAPDGTPLICSAAGGWVPGP